MLVFKVNVGFAEQITEVGAKEHQERDQVDPHQLIRSFLYQVETLGSLVARDQLVLVVLHLVFVEVHHNEDAQVEHFVISD